MNADRAPRYFDRSDDDAAVVGEDLPCEEIRPVRGEKRHRVGDVLRRAQAAQRRLLRQFPQRLLPQDLDHIRVDDPRGHAVDPDVGGGQLQRQGAGQADQRRLGAGIGNLTGGSPQPPNGGDVNDAAVLHMKHMGQHCLNGVAGAAQVDRQVAVPLFIRDVLKLDLPRDAGVVHQQRHRPQRRLRCADHGLHRRPVRYVRPHRNGAAAAASDGLRQFLRLCSVLQVIDADGTASLRQLLRNRSSDPPGRAGDQCHTIHSVPPVIVLTAV